MACVGPLSLTIGFIHVAVTISTGECQLLAPVDRSLINFVKMFRNGVPFAKVLDGFAASSERVVVDNYEAAGGNLLVQCVQGLDG
jgi:hypothetical protein